MNCSNKCSKPKYMCVFIVYKWFMLFRESFLLNLKCCDQICKVSCVKIYATLLLLYTCDIWYAYISFLAGLIYFVTFFKPTIDIGHVNAISHYLQSHLIHDSIRNVWSFATNIAHIIESDSFVYFQMLSLLSWVTLIVPWFFPSSIYTREILIFLQVITHVSWALLEYAA